MTLALCALYKYSYLLTYLRDDWTRNMVFPVASQLEPTVDLDTVFETLSFKDIGVMTLTFRGHVTSSLTCPLDLQYGFYPCDAILAWSLQQRRVRLSVCLDVRPSHAGIVPSRAKAGS